MKKRIFPLLIFLFTFWVASSQPVNINISGTLSFAGEPYIAVNPVNPQNIVLAWMAADLSTGFRVSIKSKASFNGGLTWGSQFIQPHFSPNFKSADVSMQFRKNGTLYLSYIDYRENPDSGAVYITHSLDGGVSWSSPSISFNIITDDPAKKPLDRPWLAVDNSGFISDGKFYLVTKPAPWVLPPNRPYLKSSSDSGQTWTTYRYVNTTNYLVGNVIAAPMPFPAVAADGALCIVYPSYLISQSFYPKFIFAKSYNNGMSFTYNDLLVNFPTVSNPDYKISYQLVANPLNPLQLTFIFVGNQHGDPDIFATSTINGGLTWSTPIRINDDAIANGRGQDMVWANYSKTGILLVSWRDRRNASDTGFAQPCDVYCAISRNEGLSFQSNIRLSDVTVPFDAILANSGNDFMSCELVSDSIYAAWSDVRNSKLNIYFAKTLVNCYKNNWTGTVSTAWENPLNWSCGKIPDANTDVFISGGTVIVNSAAICRTLSLNPSTVLTVKNNFTVNVLHH